MMGNVPVAVRQSVSSPFLSAERRTRRALGKALVSAGAAIAVADGRARAARTVTLIGFGDWFQPAFEQAVLGPFKKANPGFDVFFYPVATSLQTLALLRGQRSYP